MDKPRSRPLAAAGFTMIEVLISLLILTFGLLGLVGIQAMAQRSEAESYQRAQALVLLQDMVDRINVNRKVAGCYAFTPSAGTVFAGTGATAPTCGGAFGTAQQRAQADVDMAAWHNLLRGAAESLGANQVGAMIGARGCVMLDTTVNPNVYQVQVAWQGLTPTINPTSVDPKLTCATGQYGSELQRRVISQSFPMACLSC
ncbi:MAG: type IV pilus modification protein PilV [Burkholderiales bacterium]